MENDLQLNVLASRIPRAVDSVPVCRVASGLIGQRFVWPAFCLAGVLFDRRFVWPAKQRLARRLRPIWRKREYERNQSARSIRCILQNTGVDPGHSR